jgi:pimeloyl-ACP methyl ester carboxylesterase
MREGTEIVEAAGFEVEISGDRSKPLMILTRMAGRDGGIWDPIWHHFEDRFTVANFDLRMPGPEGVADAHTMFRGFGDDCAAVAGALGYATFHIFGWNGGTHVALRCAADHPEKVASCLLLGPFREMPDMRGIEKGIEFMRVMMANGDALLYSHYFYMAGVSDRFIETRFDEIAAMAEQRAAGDAFVTLDIERLTRWIRALRRDWISDDELKAIRAPTLVVATGLNRWHAGPTVPMAEAVAGLIPNAGLSVMEGVGPLVLLEDPDGFAACIAPFLESVA